MSVLSDRDYIKSFMSNEKTQFTNDSTNQKDEKSTNQFIQNEDEKSTNQFIQNEDEKSTNQKDVTKEIHLRVNEMLEEIEKDEKAQVIKEFNKFGNKNRLEVPKKSPKNKSSILNFLEQMDKDLKNKIEIGEIEIDNENEINA